MSTVQIDQSYFETLLRRAECHGPTSKSVVLSEFDHNELLRCKREYHALREALCRGGVSSETLDVLIQESSPFAHLRTTSLSWVEDDYIPKSDSRHVHITIKEEDTTPRPRLDRSKSADHDGQGTDNNGLQRSQVRPQDVADPGVLDLDDDVDGYHSDKVQKQRGDKGGAKGGDKGGENTLWFMNLPNGVSHKDITSIVRGGRLVDMWLHRKHRAAAVTFAEGSADFLAYAKRNDVYIGSKRVEVTVAERQFSFPTHLVNKLRNGASRNLVIRNAARKLTEERIRADMEHIHNLVVIAIVWQGADAYISTNSVNNAMFAKTCMISRALYKGLRIDWYPDECAEPVPKRAAYVKKEVSAFPIKSSTLTNRFNMLNIDESEDGNDEESEDGSRTSGIDVAPRSMGTSTILSTA